MERVIRVAESVGHSRRGPRRERFLAEPPALTLDAERVFLYKMVIWRWDEREGTGTLAKKGF